MYGFWYRKDVLKRQNVKSNYAYSWLKTKYFSEKNINFLPKQESTWNEGLKFMLYSGRLRNIITNYLTRYQEVGKYQNRVPNQETLFLVGSWLRPEDFCFGHPLRKPIIAYCQLCTWVYTGFLESVWEPVLVHHIWVVMNVCRNICTVLRLLSHLRIEEHSRTHIQFTLKLKHKCILKISDYDM